MVACSSFVSHNILRVSTSSILFYIVVGLVLILGNKHHHVDACGFIVANFNISKLDGVLEQANYFNRHRGPDATNIQSVGDKFHFLHNLLSMTGNATLQPFVSSTNNVATVFNGEIYNYNDLATELEDFGANGQEQHSYASDGFSILPAYAQWGDGFVEHLHGEFALVLVDFTRDVIILSTDVFSTKPLWHSTWPCDGEGGVYVPDSAQICFMAASYQSVLKGFGVPSHLHTMANANEVVVISTNTYEIVSRSPVFQFDLRQHKTTTDDWEKAFVEAVRIRTDRVKHKMFIGLSAGFDSGAIMLALQILRKPFYAYYIGNRKESESVIRERIGYCEDSEATLIYMDSELFATEKKWLNRHAEKFLPTFSVLHKSKCEGPKFRQEKLQAGTNITTAEFLPAIATSIILSDVRSRGGLIYLTGTGADEIMSDYVIGGKTVSRERSYFNGIFPANLTDIFPWCSFYYATQRDYIMYTELTGGAHGIESRYPFLDPHVVQEFLWLTAAVKNSEYKKPIADFLRKHNFPNMWSKVGFEHPTYIKKTAKVVLNAQSNDVNVARGAESRPQNLPANDLQTVDVSRPSHLATATIYSVKRDRLWRESLLPYYACAFVGLLFAFVSKRFSRRDKSAKMV